MDYCIIIDTIIFLLFIQEKHNNFDVISDIKFDIVYTYHFMKSYVKNKIKKTNWF